jgi:hypothetical protein
MMFGKQRAEIGRVQNGKCMLTELVFVLGRQLQTTNTVYESKALPCRFSLPPLKLREFNNSTMKSISKALP